MQAAACRSVSSQEKVVGSRSFGAVEVIGFGRVRCSTSSWASLDITPSLAMLLTRHIKCRWQFLLQLCLAAISGCFPKHMGIPGFCLDDSVASNHFMNSSLPATGFFACLWSFLWSSCLLCGSSCFAFVATCKQFPYYYYLLIIIKQQNHPGFLFIFLLSITPERKCLIQSLLRFCMRWTLWIVPLLHHLALSTVSLSAASVSSGKHLLLPP